MARKQLTFYASNAPANTDAVAFTYLPTSKPSVIHGRIRVDFVDFSSNGIIPPGSRRSGSIETVTEDVKEAFENAIAQLSDHHSQFRPVVKHLED